MVVPDDLGPRTELLTAKHAAFIKKFAEVSGSITLVRGPRTSAKKSLVLCDFLVIAAEHK